MLLLAATLPFLFGCAGRFPYNRNYVSKALEQRVGEPLAPRATDSGFALPPDVSLDNGLSQEEAVAIALWNNRAFQADVAALGFARADLIEAGLLRNPVLSGLFPLGPKQLEATAIVPFEVLWQRPRRVKIAKLNAQGAAESLIQSGLNLARDVKVAYAEVRFSDERSRLAAELARVQSELVDIADARLRSGDISEMEAIAARAEAQLVREQAERLAAESAIARERLRLLLGMVNEKASSELEVDESPNNALPPLDSLVEQALAMRPDLRAAELRVEAARGQKGLERGKVIALSGIADANQRGREGFEVGPGVQTEIPLFNQNSGERARAETEFEVATQRYQAVRQQVSAEVRQAYTRFKQARRSEEAWKNAVLPRLEESLKGAERSYSTGEVSYLFVLQSTRQLQESQLRGLEISANSVRSLAELERSIGSKLGNKP